MTETLFPVGLSLYLLIDRKHDNAKHHRSNHIVEDILYIFAVSQISHKIIQYPIAAKDIQDNIRN
jgi:hypothetical protein